MTTNLEEEFLRAAKKGNKEEIKRAVEAGVDINVCDMSGRNALDKVARTEKNSEIIEYLLANGIEIHKSLLTDDRAKLDEEMKIHLGDVYNQQREVKRRELKAKLRKEGPKVIFEMEEDGIVSRASVTFQAIDDTLTVDFAFARYYKRNIENLDLTAYIKDRAVDAVQIVRSKYPSDCNSYEQKGIIPYLKKAKFNGNADSYNKIIAEAQKTVLKKWPEYEKELQAKRVKQEQERIAETDEIGQELQNKYGFMFENQQENVAKKEDKTDSLTDNPNISKLAILRKKIAHDIDETLGTHFEEKKIAKPLRKIEKIVSDKLFGKVNE